MTPGISVGKIVECFEEAVGSVRGQSIPCDNSIQLEDVSHTLKPGDASSFRSVVGMALYLGRDRADAIFTIKELADEQAKSYSFATSAQTCGLLETDWRCWSDAGISKPRKIEMEDFK